MGIRTARAIGADVNGMGLSGPLPPTGIVGNVEATPQMKRLDGKCGNLIYRKDHIYE